MKLVLPNTGTLEALYPKLDPVTWLFTTIVSYGHSRPVINEGHIKMR